MSQATESPASASAPASGGQDRERVSSCREPSPKTRQVFFSPNLAAHAPAPNLARIEKWARGEGSGRLEKYREFEARLAEAKRRPKR